MLAAVGAGAGYIAGRALMPASATAATKLAEGILSHAALSAAGPIIAASIVSASAIVSAIAIPLVVIWAISREDT
jgi:hypothetical protein